MQDIFTIANKNFNSRLIVGTGKYKNFDETAAIYLDENKNPSFFNYSDIEDTDQFITILRDKYSSQTNNKKNNPSDKTIPNQNTNLKESIPNVNINQTNKPSINQVIILLYWVI